MTFKEKLRNSGDISAIITANVLDNISVESLGTFQVGSNYRNTESPSSYGVPVGGRVISFELYKVFDYNNSITSGRKPSNSAGARVLYDGTQVSFVVVPQIYKGDNAVLRLNPMEYVEGFGSTFVSLSNPRLVVVARDYPANIATVAEAELLREEEQYRQKYGILKTDGTVSPPTKDYFSGLTEAVLKENLPEELGNF